MSLTGSGISPVEEEQGGFSLVVKYRILSTMVCFCCHYLSECKRPIVIFEHVLYRPQLSEFREVRKRLQPADGFLQLLLILYHEIQQQTEHLQGQREVTKINLCCCQMLQEGRKKTHLKMHKSVYDMVNLDPLF